MYKGQGLSHSGLSDPPLLGIPRLWERIASPRPKHAFRVRHEYKLAFRGLPAPVGAGKRPAVPGIVARVQPRASKGITDLLLLSVSDGFRTVNPSKKSYSISGGLGVRDPRPNTNERTYAGREERTEDQQPQTQTQEAAREGCSRHATHRARSNRLVSRGESRSLSELTRQITPPTKNGHAPPSTESRKSSQSVNRTRVLAW